MSEEKLEGLGEIYNVNVGINPNEIQKLLSKFMTIGECILGNLKEHQEVTASYNVGVLMCAINNSLNDYRLKRIIEEEEND